MKTFTFIDNNTVEIDGQTFRKEESKPLPEFKLGDWVILKPYNKHFPQRISEINRPYFWVDNETDGYLFRDTNGFYNLRLATPAEIEAHLRKICDEKYVGKRVKCLVDGRYIVSDFWEYSATEEGICYRAKGDSDGVWLYKRGKWAEILPDKKPLPKTKDDFITFLTHWLEDDQDGFSFTADNKDEWGTGINNFLDQYDFQ